MSISLSTFLAKVAAIFNEHPTYREGDLARGDTDGLREKVDVLYAVGRLTADEYQALVAQM